MAEAEAWVMIPKLDKDKTGCVLDMHPLVLCKDCKYWSKEYDSNCLKHSGWFQTTPDWFCADGEKGDG